MNSQDIQKHIDRAVGTEGTLRIPAWWMHKILSDLVRYCEEMDDSTAIEELKSYVDTIHDVLREDVSVLKEGQRDKVSSITLFPYREGYDENNKLSEENLKAWKATNERKSVYIPKNYAEGSPYYDGHSIGSYTYEEACISLAVYDERLNAIFYYKIDGERLLEVRRHYLARNVSFNSNDFITEYVNGIESVSLVEKIRLEQELPEYPIDGIIYLVPSETGEGSNILTEWVWVNGAWEQFGEFKADVDLSGYVKKEDIDSALSTTSENPVMNKVVTEKLTELSEAIKALQTTVASL